MQISLSRSEPMALERSQPPHIAAGPIRSRENQSPVPDRVGTVSGVTRRSFHRIAFTDWGSPTARCAVLCVHGLTRNSRDFDFLAMALSGRARRVVCPDLPGRGQSERLGDSNDYALPQYCNDMTTMIAALGPVEIDWVGTSLGGLIGMVLAALPGSPIRRIVINDIGPYLPWTGLMRLGANLDDAPRSFASMEEAEQHYRGVLAPFGKLEDEHWRHLTIHSVAWRSERRRFESLCDPGIARAFRNPWHYSVDLWKYWDAIQVPILVVRGEKSDLLTDDLLARMLRRNRNATAYLVKDCGHAPALIAPEQLETVGGFLRSGTAR
jgi:pimeloyl-ACP methyl ester carboxylesterase